MKPIVKREIEGAKNRFAEGTLSMEELENEIEFWLRVDECEFCDDNQLCSMHYERLLW